MRSYQLVLVLRPNLADGQKKKITDAVKSWLKDVKITKDEDWGKKTLAYTIKHETAGNYLNFVIEAKDSLPEDLEKKIVANEDILRHLVLRRK
jgi:small subunit ribosomal protein S6